MGFNSGFKGLKWPIHNCPLRQMDLAAPAWLF